MDFWQSFEELDLPIPPNPVSDERYFEDRCCRKWSTRMLNFILQQVLEQDIDGTQLAAIGANEHESDLFEGTPRIRCRSKYHRAARKVFFITHFYTRLHISCVLVTHYSMFYYTLLHIFTQCHAASRTVLQQFYHVLTTLVILLISAHCTTRIQYGLVDLFWCFLVFFSRLEALRISSNAISSFSVHSSPLSFLQNLEVQCNLTETSKCFTNLDRGTHMLRLRKNQSSM